MPRRRAHGHHGATIPMVKGCTMKLREFPSLRQAQEGKVGYILLWALGVPIPILFLIYLLRGCS
jgi:hypothetical protein